MKRTKGILIKVTPEEKALIENNAKKHKLATATYCRQKALKDG